MYELREAIFGSLQKDQTAGQEIGSQCPCSLQSLKDHPYLGGGLLLRADLLCLLMEQRFGDERQSIETKEDVEK